MENASHLLKKKILLVSRMLFIISSVTTRFPSSSPDALPNFFMTIVYANIIPIYKTAATISPV